MSDVDRLYHDYVAEHRAGGEADPLAYLGRLEGNDRAELAALIDGYLTRVPRRAFDAEEFASSPAASAVNAIATSMEGQAGLWPDLLPRLRERAQLKRSDLVSRLAQALGAPDRETKVARYYHEMEHGLLPARGVSQKVLEALGAIVGESADRLRDAGDALGSVAEPGQGGVVFARTALADSVVGSLPPPATASPAQDPPDEIDALFTGG